MRSSLPFMLALGAAAACSSSTDPSTSPPPAAAPAEAPTNEGSDAAPPPAPPPADAGSTDASSPGCGRAASGAGRITDATLDVSGKTREYHVSLPASYDPSRRHPLVFVLHGAGDISPQNMKDWFPVEANMGPSVFVYPQALPRTRKDGSGGNIPRWDLDGQEDLVFVDAMIAALEDATCIDRSRRFATGFSSGGNFAHQLACLRQKDFRAIAPVEGPGPFTDACDGPMTMWMTHDVNDTVLPVADARSARDFWAALDGCGSTWTPDTNPLCQKNTACTSGRTVTYCETTGVGHDVASFAPAAVAAFFSAQ